MEKKNTRKKEEINGYIAKITPSAYAATMIPP